MSNVVNFKARHKFILSANDDVPAVTNAPTAFELYPDDAALLKSLRQCGVQRIHGIFDAEAWVMTCRSAGLFRLPLGGLVKGDDSRIMERARSQALAADDWYWALGDPTPQFASRLMCDMRHEVLLHEIFPKGAPAGHSPFEVDFPRPPYELLPVLQRAGLAGLDVQIAAPAGAIRLPEIEKQRTRWAAAPLIDPIVFGTHRATSRVAVLGSYAHSEHDPEALKQLVEVLETLNVEL
jgi:hypothetical protein